MNQVLRLPEGITGKQAQVRYAAPSRGDVRHTSAAIRRAGRGLGYLPQMMLADGLRAAVA